MSEANDLCLGVRAKFIRAREVLCNTLIERHDEIDLLLISLLSREHALLVGAPGSAKSLLCDSLALWLKCTKFPYLLTKFTDPGEIFGPTDVPALVKEGKTQRLVEGFAPTSQLIFFDEIWKASSAILNTTLVLLNERKFRCGLQSFPCPLVMCIGASNEWPSDQEGGRELGALFDRFLFRKKVEYVKEKGRTELLRRAVANESFTPNFEEHLTTEELAQANKDVREIPWGNPAKTALWNILKHLNEKEGIHPSDRRLVKSITAARAACYLDGGSKVLPEHLEVLQHVLWEDPEEGPRKCREVVCRYAAPISMKVTDYLLQSESVVEAAFKEDGRKKEARVGEAVEKLEQILRELNTLKDVPKVQAARESVSDALGRVYKLNIGIRED